MILTATIALLIGMTVCLIGLLIQDIVRVKRGSRR